MAVPHFELARYPARGAQRQRFAYPIVIGEEEHQFDIAGLVLDEHFDGAFERALGGGRCSATRTSSVAIASRCASRIFGRARRSSVE